MGADHYLLVMDWYLYLTSEWDSPQFQFTGQSCLIDRFQESWPKGVVDFNRRPNHCPCKVSVNEIAHSITSQVSLSITG